MMLLHFSSYSIPNLLKFLRSQRKFYLTFFSSDSTIGRNQSFIPSSYLIVLRYRKDVSVAKGLNISAQTSRNIIWICYPLLAFEGIVIQDRVQSMLLVCLKLTISIFQFTLVGFILYCLKRRIPTVELKIPGKGLEKAGYQTSVGFKL